MPLSHEPSRFHRDQGQPRLPHVQRDNLISLSEPRLYIANRFFSGHSNIALLIEDLRPVFLQRGIKPSHRGQHLVININESASSNSVFPPSATPRGHRSTNLLDPSCRR